MGYQVTTNNLDSIRGGRFTNRTSQTVLKIRNTLVKFYNILYYFSCLII